MPRPSHPMPWGLPTISSAGAVLLAACSGDPPLVTLELTLGHEKDAMHADPPIERIEVTATSIEGDVALTASAVPGGTFDFGEIPADRLMSFEAKGTTAKGDIGLRGRSLALPFGSSSSGSVPLFVQRTGAWARPPGGTERAHEAAPACIVGERYVLSTGGLGAADAAGKTAELLSADYYDLALLGGAVSDAMPRVARTLVGRGSAVLIIADDGASTVDFETGEITSVAAPDGLPSFADVAGGAVIEGREGVTFVVGATRRDKATRAVLEVAADGSLRSGALRAERSGAAAAWMEDVGLVIAGGSETADGLEVLPAGGSAFQTVPYPPDATAGAGAVVIGGQLVLVGGVDGDVPAPSRSIDPKCASECVARSIQPALPIPLLDVTAFALPDGGALVVGAETTDDALLRSFLFDPASPSAIEVALREPRRGGTMVPLPNGTLAIVGGVHPDGSPAVHLETWFP